MLASRYLGCQDVNLGLQQTAAPKRGLKRRSSGQHTDEQRRSATTTPFGTRHLRRVQSPDRSKRCSQADSSNRRRFRIVIVPYRHGRRARSRSRVTERGPRATRIRRCLPSHGFRTQFCQLSRGVWRAESLRYHGRSRNCQPSRRSKYSRSRLGNRIDDDLLYGHCETVWAVA
jgi:hypothetical protein